MLRDGGSQGQSRQFVRNRLQLWTVVPFCKGNSRGKMRTNDRDCGRLWTSTLSPHLLSPHLDFPDVESSARPGGSQYFPPPTTKIAF